MVPHKVSFVERLFLSQRIPYQRFHKIVDRKLSASDTISNQTISLSLSLSTLSVFLPPPLPTTTRLISSSPYKHSPSPLTTNPPANRATTDLDI